MPFLAEPVREILAVPRVAADHADFPDRAYGGYRESLGQRLGAGPELGQHGRRRVREVARRQAGGGSGAQAAEVVCLDDRPKLSGRSVEQVDPEPGTGSPGRVGLEADQAGGRERRAHRGQEDTPLHPPAGLVLGAPLAPLAEGELHRRQGVLQRQQPLDVGFAQKQRHLTDYVWMAPIGARLRRTIARAPVGHFATAGPKRPAVVPICFALLGRTVYHAIDAKPKTVPAARLRRVRNVAANPHAAFIVDHYDDDWEKLWYVLLQGPARLLHAGAEHRRALAALTRKYPQYRRMRLDPQALVIALDVEEVRHWPRARAARRPRGSPKATAADRSGSTRSRSPRRRSGRRS